MLHRRKSDICLSIVNVLEKYAKLMSIDWISMRRKKLSRNEKKNNNNNDSVCVTLNKNSFHLVCWCTATAWMTMLLKCRNNANNRNTKWKQSRKTVGQIFWWLGALGACARKQTTTIRNWISSPDIAYL